MWPCLWPVLDIILQSSPKSHSHLPTWPNSPEHGQRPSLKRHFQEQPEKTTENTYWKEAGVKPQSCQERHKQTCQVWSRLLGSETPAHPHPPPPTPRELQAKLSCLGTQQSPPYVRRMTCDVRAASILCLGLSHVTLSKKPGRHDTLPASSILLVTIFLD